MPLTRFALLTSLFALAACSSRTSPDATKDSASEAATSAEPGGSIEAALAVPSGSARAPGPPEGPPIASGSPEEVARQKALRDAADFGLLGLLDSGAAASAQPSSASQVWGGDDSISNDPALKNLMGADLPESSGQGLGNSALGAGPGGGGGEGVIGLRDGGNIGHGVAPSGGQSSASAVAEGAKQKPPTIRMGAISVTGKLPPEVIQRIVRQSFSRFRQCYESGLKGAPGLEGMLTVQFTIATDGSVSGAKPSGDLPSEGVKTCVTKVFQALSFPKPESGVVKVSYPMRFTPAT